MPAADSARMDEAPDVGRVDTFGAAPNAAPHCLAVASTPTEGLVAATGCGCHVHVTAVEHGTVLQVLALAERVSCVAFCRTRTHLAVGGAP